jgi:hypothetical protein
MPSLKLSFLTQQCNNDAAATCFRFVKDQPSGANENKRADWKTLTAALVEKRRDFPVEQVGDCLTGCD